MSNKNKIILKFFLVFGVIFLILEIFMTKLGFRERVFTSALFKGEEFYYAILVSILVCLASSFFGYLLAKKKGRDPIKWTLFCFFANIWGIIILSFLETRKQKYGN